MTEMNKSTTFWTVLGIVILLLVLNQWMSREINQPAAPALQSPAEVLSQPTEQAQPLQTLPLPIETEEAPPVPAITAEPKDASPKIGEKVNEPIYEPPTNDVILVE